MRDRIVENPDQYSIEWIDKDSGLCRISRKPGAVVTEGSKYSVENVLPQQTCLNLGLDPIYAEPRDVFNTLTSLAASSLPGFPTELEDYTIEVGSFYNAGAGWNTRSFRTTFPTAPQVVLTLQGFAGVVQVQNVGNASFQYNVKTIGTTTNTVNGAVVVNGVNFTTTDSTSILLRYIAIGYGGT